MTLIKGKKCGIIFLDLRKAFDTINHVVLINKLFYYGINDSDLNLIKSYLHDRISMTNCNNQLSSSLKVTTGIPQGSILGPLLFNLYVNDIFSAIKEECILFADDSSVIITANTELELYAKLQHTIDTISTYLYKNYLYINCDKTNYMIFDFDKFNNQPPDILLLGIPIKHVESSKILGYIIDNRLRLKHLSDSIINKLNKYLYISYKIRNKLTISCKLLVYYNLIYIYYIL